ncbi:MAG: SDR family NAD(P)-dependent oxidoreductase [Chitinophagaceae bacterium]
MKTALVTGAAGNLGQAVVNKFLSEGYHVVGLVSSRIVLPGHTEGNYERAAIDLTEADSAEHLVASVISTYGRIDTAVLAVGGFAMGGFADATAASLTDQYKLNFETAYNIARPVFLQMLQQGSGRIYLVGSRQGLDTRNGKGVVAYALAKSLLFRLAELMNAEAEGRDVVVSVIVPGTIDTPQNRESMPDADFNSWTKPETIAEIIWSHSTAGSVQETVIPV